MWTETQGDRAIQKLLADRLSGDFTDWEETFIHSLAGRKWSDLNARDKHVVSRLYGWLTGSTQDVV